jgi:hypothetical protein
VGISAIAIETMFFSEAHQNRVSAGSTVNVRFDPRDNLVALVRVNQKSAQDDHDDNVASARKHCSRKSRASSVRYEEGTP